MKVLLGLILAISAIARQQAELPRRGYFGVGLEKAATGVRIFSVAPGSTAAAMGVAIGDVIDSVDGKAMSTPEGVIAALGKHRSGAQVSIGVVRDEQRRVLSATLKVFPVEQMANATVLYDSVRVAPDTRLRTILSVPTNSTSQRFPAVFMIGGGGCGSIDTPFSPTIAIPGLVQAIGSRGFVTMRVEKSGIGDSEGPPCDTIGYKEELAGYQAALKVLLSHPSVDRQRIYLIGISLGGTFAPIIAAETKVAGIVVWGSPGGPPKGYPGRSERFFEEFSHVDVAGAWSKVGTRVLALHGEFDVDPVIDRKNHELIAAMVNKANPGSAEFRELPGLDHGWTRHASLEASQGKVGQGAEDNTLRDAILEFLTTGASESSTRTAPRGDVRR